MAKFEIGHAKIGGRKKGTPNKATIKAKSIRQMFNDILADELQSGNFAEQIAHLRDHYKYRKDYVNTLIRIADMFLPKTDEDDNAVDLYDSLADYRECIVNLADDIELQNDPHKFN